MEGAQALCGMQVTGPWSSVKIFYSCAGLTQHGHAQLGYFLVLQLVRLSCSLEKDVCMRACMRTCVQRALRGCWVPFLSLSTYLFGAESAFTFPQQG